MIGPNLKIEKSFIHQALPIDSIQSKEDVEIILKYVHGLFFDINQLKKNRILNEAKYLVQHILFELTEGQGIFSVNIDDWELNVNIIINKNLFADYFTLNMKPHWEILLEHEFDIVKIELEEFIEKLAKEKSKELDKKIKNLEDKWERI